MSLFIAVLTFFILMLLLMCVRDNPYYFLLFGFMGMFITYSISDMFNSGSAFTNQIALGFTQQYWLQAMYGFFTLMCFARAVVSATRGQSVEAQ